MKVLGATFIVAGGIPGPWLLVMILLLLLLLLLNLAHHSGTYMPVESIYIYGSMHNWLQYCYEVV